MRTSCWRPSRCWRCCSSGAWRQRTARLCLVGAGGWEGAVAGEDFCFYFSLFFPLWSAHLFAGVFSVFFFFALVFLVWGGGERGSAFWFVGVGELAFCFVRFHFAGEEKLGLRFHDFCLRFIKFENLFSVMKLAVLAKDQNWGHAPKLGSFHFPFGARTLPALSLWVCFKKRAPGIMGETPRRNSWCARRSCGRSGRTSRSACPSCATGPPSRRGGGVGVGSFGGGGGRFLRGNRGEGAKQKP